MAELVEETMSFNELVLGPLLPHHWRSSGLLPHTAQTWLRNYVGGFLLYIISASFFYIRSRKSSTTRLEYSGSATGQARRGVLLSQIWWSIKSMPVFVCMPTMAEYMIEKGWTRCYGSIRQVGAAKYVAYTMVYLVLVEFGIYWAHRALHDVKPLYKWVHAPHHSYYKEDTLTPFAGMALNPLDGILQGSPYVICLFLVPMHYLTYMILLFMEVLWTTNIHDNFDGKVWPIMGAGYHTIHHTTYRHNYGKYTIWMDSMFGTLRDPIRPKAS